ncbi:hypothetical protein GCM10023148_07960 [Actinokineospora soli]
MDQDPAVGAKPPGRHRKPDALALGPRICLYIWSAFVIFAGILVWTGAASDKVAGSPVSRDSAPSPEALTTSPEPPPPPSTSPRPREAANTITGRPTTTKPPAPTTTSTTRRKSPFPTVGEPCQWRGAVVFDAEYKPVVCSESPNGDLVWQRFN